MNNEQFPHAIGAGAQHPELFIRDIFFLNYHINHDKWDWFRYYELADAHRFEEDFFRYNAADWTITTTEAGGGAATEALIDFVNGVLLVTNDAADNDCDELVNSVETFAIIRGYPLYFEFRSKVSDGLESNFWAGIIDQNSYFAGQSVNGIYFLKPDDENNLYFGTSVLGTEVLVDTGIDVSDLDWGRVGFHWDGAGTVRWFVMDDTQLVVAAGYVTTNIPEGYGTFNPGFGIRNGEAVAKLMYVDYIKCDMPRIPSAAEDLIDENVPQ